MIMDTRHSCLNMFCIVMIIMPVDCTFVVFYSQGVFVSNGDADGWRFSDAGFEPSLSHSLCYSHHVPASHGTEKVHYLFICSKAKSWFLGVQG